MNKTAIKNFAVNARVSLMEAARQRAYEYEIVAGAEPDRNLSAVGGRVLSSSEKEQRKKLVSEISAKGYEQVIEEAAYTWFNRFAALRYMEVNGYLPSHIRVFTDENGSFKPEILKEAMSVEIDGIDRARVFDLIDKQDNEGLFKYLVITQCNALGKALPGMFEHISDYTELLFPNNLLRPDSVLAKMVENIPEADWQDAEIIGWLYQYYITEKHEEAVDPLHSKTVKKEDIPAATQLFTTDWVVKYVIDNSLGRYWIERNPKSNLAEKLEFFVTPKNGEITYINEPVLPEELKVFDPCCGSGHFLTYAFDVLMQIYSEAGWSEREAAASIVRNNLFGLDIDDRAGQLAYFAVMMRARKYNRGIFREKVSPNIFALKDSSFLTEDLIEAVTCDDIVKKSLFELRDAFSNAKEFGSLIHVPDIDLTLVSSVATAFCERFADDLMASAYQETVTDNLIPLIKQAIILSGKYEVVATNPPFLNKFDATLKKFLTKEYKDYSSDLFSVFMYRNFDFCKENGYSGFMTPNVWMFIKSYEKLRNYILKEKNIVSLIQMAKGAFFKEATVDICAFILKNAKENIKGLYFRLEDFKGGMEVQREKVLEALANKNCGYFYETTESNFFKIPGSPIAYWVSEKLLGSFSNGFLLGTIANPKTGLETTDNNRFIRLWHEILFDSFKIDAHSCIDALNSKKKWFPHNKGGVFRKWYGNNDYVVNWENDGWAIKHFTDDKGKQKSQPRNMETYFHESITWSKISSGTIAFRYKPFGHIYDSAGTSVFAETEMLFYLAGFCNSCVAMNFAQMLSPTINYEVGHISRFPIEFSNDVAKTVIKVVNRCISDSKDDWDAYETSWDFKRNPMI